MDKYIVFFDHEKVTSYTQYETGKLVFPAKNLRFVYGTIKQALGELIKNGINPSKLWKEGLTQPLTPGIENPEIHISNHPSEVLTGETTPIQRRAFVAGLGVVYYPNQSDKFFNFSVVIRHFDRTGEYLNTIHDEFINLRIDNSTQMKGGKNYDYYISLLKGGANLLTLQSNSINSMDSNGRFNASIYE